MQFIWLSKAVTVVALAAALHPRDTCGQELMVFPIAGQLLAAKSPAAYKPDPDAEGTPMEDSLFHISQFPVFPEIEPSSEETAAIPGKETRNNENDEEGVILSLMQRFSLNSTYLDATGGESAKSYEKRLKEKAPSEVRFTLFSIPLKD